MKVFIVEVVLPDSWQRIDVVCAMNIGVQKHWQTQNSGSPVAGQRQLEDPRGILTSTAVLAGYPVAEPKP